MSARVASGGRLVVDSLLAHGVDTVWCVPGESYLAVLDALHDERERVRLVTCRHESGAALMAAASAELRGRPGVCCVTRGPGATNAAIALHVAMQGSIPLVLLVGQVSRASLGREAFQELDYAQFCAPLAKHVEQVLETAALPAACARAFHSAASGRPGPVVLVVPEDVLGDSVAAGPVEPIARVARAPAPEEVAAIARALAASERPLVLFGGAQVSDRAGTALADCAGRNTLPVMTPFRRQDCFDNQHPSYAGYLGYGAPPVAWTAAAESDCVLVIGGRLDEPSTQGYTLFRDGAPRTLIHVYPNARELQLNYRPELAIVADTEATAIALSALQLPPSGERAAWCKRLRAAFESARLPHVESGLDPAAAMAVLDDVLPDDAIVTSDAGNFSLWPQRGRRYRRPGRLLAPVNGAMGYGVPAAVAAALTCPERIVVGCVGDGGMGMTGMELATAARYGARPIILVFNNGRYGTIEMHQDRRYPGRRIGTELSNPDFGALARSFGLFGARVDDNDGFAGALTDALAADTASVIDLVLSEA